MSSWKSIFLPCAAEELHSLAMVIQSNIYSSGSVGRIMSDLVTAAHSMTSFLGQGACQAIEDATELANLLQLYFTPESSSPHQRGTEPERPLSIPDLLQRYSDARSSRAQQIASFSNKYAMFHTAQLPYGLGPIVRQLVYTWLPLWCFIWCFAWLYGYQPVVHGVSHSQRGFIIRLYDARAVIDRLMICNSYRSRAR